MAVIENGWMELEAGLLYTFKVARWVSTVLHADSPPCAKSPTLKQVVLGRILTVLAQVWRVGSS